MIKKKILTHKEIASLTLSMHQRIKQYFIKDRSIQQVAPILKIYGVPRGGIPVAYLLMSFDPNHYTIVEHPSQADLIVDDIIDSGKTKKSFQTNILNIPFFALVDKELNPDEFWYVFTWEQTEEKSIEDNITRIIQFAGDDPTREGLLETPARVSKALSHWFSGYAFNEEDIKKELKCFKDGSEGVDEMVIRRNIPLYSHCEHHMAPIFGTCTIAYIPEDKVLGLSKFDRLVEIFARRLQVQERLTNQIADALWNNLNPVGVGVYINARHMCVESRGVCHQSSETITTALRGAMREEASSRAEFLAACRG